MTQFHSLLADSGVPVVPPSYNVALSSGTTGTARVSLRQTTLEPSAAGVDSAMSWSAWIHQSNVRTTAMRIFGCANTADGNQQYVLQTNPQDFQSSTRNQRLNFTIFTNGTNFITIESTNRFLRNRWTHVTITYTGSETTAGLKMYLNGVEDTTAGLITTGTYTGALNGANLRFMISRADSATNRYGGDLRDLAVWNRVLTSGEVTSLFNAGVPVVLSALGFYAAAIRAWWPLESSLANVNNVAFDLVSSAGITFRSIPLSPTYEQLTFFNADVLNTRYLAFGGMYKVGPGSFVANTRSGTTHLANGKVVKMALNALTLTPASPVDILTDGTYDLRNISTGKIDDDVAVLVTRFIHTTGPTVDLLRFTSTDGLIGEAFDSGTSMPTSLNNFSFYGKLIKGDAVGEYLVPEYEVNTAATVYELNVFKRSSGGVWSKVNVWSGDNTAAYVEPAICRVGYNTYFMIARSQTLVGLHLFYSPDGGNTWSGPNATGLGAGICMCDMAMNPIGKLSLVYADRSTSRLTLSSGNVIADIIADPTDWINIGDLFQSYATDTTGILGYPSIVYDGWKVCISLSAEFSSSRSDLYWAYGVLG